VRPFPDTAGDPEERRTLGALLGGWFLVWTVVSVLAIRDEGAGVGWARSVAASLLFAGAMLVIPAVGWVFVYRPRPAGRGWLAWQALHGATVALLVPALLAAGALIDRAMGLRWEGGSWSVDDVHGVLIQYALLLPVVVVLARARRARDQRRAEARFRERVVWTELRRTRAELRALRMEHTPRFLFDALEAIARTVRGDAAAAGRAILALSALLRQVLENAGDAEASVRDEVQAATLLVEMERCVGHPVPRVEWRLGPGAGEARVPHLLLLPLLEILARCARPACVRGYVRVRGDLVVIRMHATGAAPAREAVDAELGPVRARLERVHARAGLTTRVRRGATLAVTVVAPVPGAVQPEPHPEPERPSVVEAGTLPGWLGWALYALLWGGAVVGGRAGAEAPLLFLALRAALVPGTLFLAFRLTARFPVRRGRALRHLGVHAAAALAAGAGLVALRTARAGGDALAPGAVGMVLLYAAFAAVAHWERHWREERDARAARERLRLELAEAELRWGEAELKSLEMQLHPHFLFNALTSVSALVLFDPEAAERVVRDLGALLRHAFDPAGSHRVPLREELDVVRLYLGIEHVRFQDRLSVDWRVEPDALDVVIPRLVVQPLVENAIKHAIAHRMTPGTLRISAARSGDSLRLSVADDGAGGAPVRSDGGTRIGLANIRTRMEALYGSRWALDLRPNEAGGTTAELLVPLRMEPDAAERGELPPRGA
jgi:LytS/YehU family sensor histidine kinase